MVANAATAIRLPPEMNAFQAAMLTVNPSSAWGMLNSFVELAPGEWILQNAANSAVGRCVIQIARSSGWRTLNLVRRPDVIEELKLLGADAVAVEGCDLREVCAEHCGAARPRLGLNAVGGASAFERCGGRPISHAGDLWRDGAATEVPSGLLIFAISNSRDLGEPMARPSRRQNPKLWNALARLSVEAKLPSIHRIFPLNNCWQLSRKPVLKSATAGGS